MIFRGYLAWARAGVETQQLVLFCISFLFFSLSLFPFFSSPLSHTDPPTLVSELGRSYSRFSDAIVYVALLSHTLVIPHRYPLSTVVILLHLVFQS